MYSLPILKRSCFLLTLCVVQIGFAADTAVPITEVLRKSEQLIDAKNYPEAIALLESDRIRRATQNDERAEALVLDQIGVAYAREGRYLAARNAFDSSIARLTRAEGEDNVGLIRPLNNLANLLYESDQVSQAEALVRRALAILSTMGPPDERTGGELAVLAKMYLGENKLSLAQQSAEEALNVLQQAGHSEDLWASIAWSVLGDVYDVRKNSDSAEDSLKHSLSILQKNLDPEDYRVAEGIANLGLFYANQGLPAEAEPLLEQAHSSFHSQAVNTLFVRSYLRAWSDFERKAGHKEKAKNLNREAEALVTSRSEGSMSRFIVDANALR